MTSGLLVIQWDFLKTLLTVSEQGETGQKATGATAKSCVTLFDSKLSQWDDSRLPGAMRS
jgi:hypothetical protein